MAQTSKISVKQLDDALNGMATKNDLRFRKSSDKIGSTDLTSELNGRISSGGGSSDDRTDKTITFPDDSTIVETQVSGVKTIVFATNQAGNDICTITEAPTTGDIDYIKTIEFLANGSISITNTTRAKA